MVALFQPALEPGQQRTQVLLVSDEIVVDEIDMPAITVIVERLQFGENLIVALGARHASIQLDDVAELARERTAARILHANEKVVFELEQIVTRHRTSGDVDLEFLGNEHALALAALPGVDELLHDLLGFADNLEIRVGINMRAGGDIGAADTHRLAMLMGKIDQVNEIR